MKNELLRRRTYLTASIVLLIVAAPAWAAPLVPGGSVTIGSGNVVSGTGVAGGVTILADTGWRNSSTGNPNLGGGTGAAREIVVRGDTSNPYGGLDFIYQLQNTSSNSSGVNLSSLNAFSFASSQTDVIAANPNASSFANKGNSFGAPTTGGGNDPSSVSRSSNGREVTYHFLDSNNNGALAPGSYSDLLIVRTDAANYAPGRFDFSDGGTSGQLSGFGPSQAPEPASVVLLAGCLAVLGIVSLWQRWRIALVLK